MIKVFLWKRLGRNVGHLAMKLSDGTYISFWPREDLQIKRKKRSIAQICYQDDVDCEGREADETLELPEDIVDQNKIKEWWRGYTDKNKYHLLIKNCSLVVKEALIKGGIFRSNFVDELGEIAITPYEVFTWAKQCKELYPQKQDNSLAARGFRAVRDYFASE